MKTTTMIETMTEMMWSECWGAERTQAKTPTTPRESTLQTPPEATLPPLTLTAALQNPPKESWEAAMTDSPPRGVDGDGGGGTRL